MNWIKNILIIICITITPPLVFDVIFLHDKLDSLTTGWYGCDKGLTNYDYCPSITHIRYMTLVDKWLPAVNFIDQNSRSIYKYEEIPEIKKNKRIFLIGDSFIQAEEMGINSRFEHYLRQIGYEVIAIGYSSWNSVQYHSIIQSLKLNKNDYVFVFSMANDFTPSYERASINTVLDDRKDKTFEEWGYHHQIEHGPGRSFLNKIRDNSLIINTYTRAKTQYDYMFGAKEVKDKQIQISHNDKNMDDCSIIPAIEEVGSNLVREYIYLSKSSECWTDEIKSSVDFNIDLLKESQRKVESQDAIFNIVFVPAGWALKNENSIGRMAKSYQIPNHIIISHVGLSRHLQNAKLTVLDLEEFLRHQKTSNVDELYFPVDGHWNEKAHKIIGKYLEEFLKSFSERTGVVEP